MSSSFEAGLKYDNVRNHIYYIFTQPPPPPSHFSNKVLPNDSPDLHRLHLIARPCVLHIEWLQLDDWWWQVSHWKGFHRRSTNPKLGPSFILSPSFVSWWHIHALLFACFSCWSTPLQGTSSTLSSTIHHNALSPQLCGVFHDLVCDINTCSVLLVYIHFHLSPLLLEYTGFGYFKVAANLFPGLSCLRFLVRNTVRHEMSVVFYLLLIVHLCCCCDCVCLPESSVLYFDLNYDLLFNLKVNLFGCWLFNLSIALNSLYITCEELKDLSFTVGFPLCRLSSSTLTFNLSFNRRYHRCHYPQHRLSR